MTWAIPAKTFLLGEYAALAEASALIVTTRPCFELSLINKQTSVGIHEDSPAGLWWQQAHCIGKGLRWFDPYQGRGGLGASSAQFLGCYLATCSIKGNTPNLQAMLSAYYQVAWTGTGLRPSGYDVIAQSQQGCIFINKKNQLVQAYDWTFADLSLIVLHTGQKLATHHHLQNTVLPKRIDKLSALVDEAREAFEHANSAKLIHCINDYHQQLVALNLVAPHTLEAINQLKTYSEVLAAKGCGALGADTILLLIKRDTAALFKEKLLAHDWLIIATENDLTPKDHPSLLDDRL